MLTRLTGLSFTSILGMSRISLEWAQATEEAALSTESA